MVTDDVTGQTRPRNAQGPVSRLMGGDDDDNMGELCMYGYMCVCIHEGMVALLGGEGGEDDDNIGELCMYGHVCMYVCMYTCGCDCSAWRRVRRG